MDLSNKPFTKNLELKESLELFFKDQDLKPKSKSTYKKAIKNFLLYLKENNISAPIRADILHYKESLKYKSPYTISSYITSVRLFFTWCENVGIYPNIAKGIKGAKLPKGFNKDTLTPKQVHLLLDSITGTEEQSLRDFALINLLIRTGLRTVEVARANIEDIRQQGGKSILYIQGKGRDFKDDFVLLTNESILPIYKYLALREHKKDTEPLFCGVGNRNKGSITTESLSRIIKTRLRKAHLDNKKITAHSLRHTAITFSLLGGASLQEARELARHSNINTTMIYSQNLDKLSDNSPVYKISKILDENI
jgi:site-specific recombinase XerD